MTDRPKPKGTILPLAFVVYAIVHLALLVYFEPLVVTFSGDPIAHRDFHTHAEQTWRVTEALDGWGRSWAYDVQLLAGYPSGTVFDADNKAWELWTYALWKIGVPRPVAFNLFVLLAHLALPLVLLASARLLEMTWRGALAAMCLGTLVWFFDSLVHTCHWIGMVAFAIVGAFFVLPLALAQRYLQQGRWHHAALLALALALGHLVHPYLFIVLAPPILAIYIRAFRTLGWQRHAGLWAAALVAIVANLYWIVVALSFWRHVLSAGFFGASTLSYLVSDFLGLLRDPTVTGVMENRTGFRILVVAGAVAGLVAWRRGKDPRFLPFTVGLASMGALVYLGGYFWITQQIQPYRFLLPFTFMAAIPAAAFIDDLIGSRTLSKLPWLAKTAIAIVALVALPHLVRDVLYFMPVLVPAPPGPAERKPAGDRMSEGASLQKMGPVFRRRPLPVDYVRVAEWIESNHEHGRILVEKPELGEFLAWRTRAEILGGFQLRNMQHTAANLFRRHPHGDIGDKDLERYLEDYAVSHVVMTRKMPTLELRDQIFEPIKWIPPHRVYRSKRPVSYFHEGSGSIKASMNRIEVTGSDPSTIILRFHHLHTLVCSPDCRVERHEMPDDPVGFIKIPQPHPADFVIENGY